MAACLLAVDSRIRRHMPRFHSDLHEGIEQTDAQLFGKERSRTIPQQKMAETKLYNPLYWATLLLSVPQHGQKCPLSSAPARLLCLPRARLAALRRKQPPRGVGRVALQL